MKFSGFLIALIFLIVFNCEAQYSYSVKSSHNLQSSYFGYKINKFVPFIGVKYYGGGIEYTSTGKETNWQTNQITDYSRKNEFNVNLIIPQIGVKYYIIDNEDIKGYLTTSFIKPFIILSGNEDGEAIEELEEQNSRFNLIGNQTGFGAEYFISDHFSIGSETCIWLNFGSYDNSWDSNIFDPQTGNIVEYESTEVYDFNINLIYANISINYYFGGK